MWHIISRKSFLGPMGSVSFETLLDERRRRHAADFYNAWK
jgi:hypothetical protein